MNHYCLEDGHVWEDKNCWECFGFVGMVCRRCGDWYDGGDPNFEQWCGCEWGNPNPPDEEEE